MPLIELPGRGLTQVSVELAAPDRPWETVELIGLGQARVRGEQPGHDEREES